MDVTVFITINIWKSIYSILILDILPQIMKFGTKLLNFGHKAITLTLVSITLTGAYICGDFGYSVLRRKYLESDKPKEEKTT